MSQSPDDNYYVDKVDDPLAKSGVNSVVGLGAGLVNKIYTHFQDKQQANKAAAAYAEKYRERYGKIRLFTMSQDINLEEVYTTVKFLDQLSIQRRYGSLNALEDNYREGNSRRFQQGEGKSIPGSEVANKHRLLYVLGNPGAGKSTFLRKVGLEAIKGKQGNDDYDCIPVMIELKQFNQGQVDLVNAIADELAYFGFPDKRQATEGYLKDGKLLLLFDGVDEVPQANVDGILDGIAKLVTQYRDNRFILSCRIAAYKSAMTGFTTVELADFDASQIEGFIHNWFCRDVAIADACWTKLSQPEYKASFELAQTPLLLTFLCITYQVYEDFPAQRNQLYAEALDILLRKWDAEKRGIKRDKIKDLYIHWNINLELALLAELAHDFFVNDQLFFKKDSVLQKIQTFLSDTAGEARNIDTEAVLAAIVIQQGILVERAAGIYSFSHLTLQEYLTAKYLSQDNQRLETLVKDHLTDRRWREVFLLVAGIRDNADIFLLLMAAETQKLINTPKLHNLLAWVEKVTDPHDGDFKHLGKKAITIAYANAYAYAIAYANAYAIAIANANAYAIANANANAYAIANANANAYAIAYAIANANANAYAIANAYANAYAIAIANAYAYAIAIAYANAIESFLDYIKWSKTWQIYQNINYDFLVVELNNLKQQIPPDDAPSETKKQFSKLLIDTWLTHFYTSRDEMTLSQSELIALDNYLYSNLLIIQTNQAASRVTHPTWSQIEGNMLRIVTS